MKSILQQHIYGAYKFLRNVSDDEESEQEEEEKESNHAISLIEEDDITKTSNLQTFWNIFNANQGVARGCWMSDLSYQTSDFRCPKSNVRRLMLV